MSTLNKRARHEIMNVIIVTKRRWSLMEDRRFTREEANSLLPILRAELAAMQETKRKYAEKLRLLRELKEFTPLGDQIDPYFEHEVELEFLQIEARSQLRSFQLKGVQLKDLDMGLVDFPAVVNGQEVLLCWKLGEEEVSHYHGWHEGFHGRKPIEDLPN
jgi:hypothetical protein